MHIKYGFKLHVHVRHNLTIIVLPKFLISFSDKVYHLNLRRRYMAGILLIRRKTQENQSINFLFDFVFQTTEVTLTLKMNTRGPTQFAIVSVFKKETFAISTDEAKIVPASEPDAEIDIPKGAFEKAAELQLNVSYLRGRAFFIVLYRGRIRRQIIVRRSNMVS